MLLFNRLRLVFRKLRRVSRKPVPIVYVYKKSFKRGSESVVIDALAPWVRTYIDNDEFRSVFGGSIFTTDSSDGNSASYKGVWGRNNVRLFKRLLRQRGATFLVYRIDGACRRIIGWETRD